MKKNDVAQAEYWKNEFWSEDLLSAFGEAAAKSFSIGCDLLENWVNEDMSRLAVMPAGSHAGQLESGSFIYEELPEQFLTRYDYQFFCLMSYVLEGLKRKVRRGFDLKPKSVIEELVIYLAIEEAKGFFESEDIEFEDDDWDDWIFDLFGDEDVVTCLYSGMYLPKECMYHFDHWTDGYVNLELLDNLGLLAGQKMW